MNYHHTKHTVPRRPRRYTKQALFPEPESTLAAQEAVMAASYVEVKKLDLARRPWVLFIDGTAYASHDKRGQANADATRWSRVVPGAPGESFYCDQRLLVFKAQDG